MTVVEAFKIYNEIIKTSIPAELKNEVRQLAVEVGELRFRVEKLLEREKELLKYVQFLKGQKAYQDQNPPSPPPKRRRVIL